MDYEQQQIIIKNIDNILKKRKIKRSTVQEAVGVSAGYLSRLQRPKEKALVLSYDLLDRIAVYLGVSTDYLKLNTLEHTTDEYSLIDFFESLYFKSIKNDLFWNLVNLSYLNGQRDPDRWDIYGPIAKKIEAATAEDLECYPDYLSKQIEELMYQEKNPWGILWIGWQSIGKGKEIDDNYFTRATIIDDVLYTDIDNIDSTLYLYKVEYSDSNNDKKLAPIIEAYLVTNEKNYFLCNSIDWGDYISSKLKDVYQIAKEKSSKNRLDEEVKNILNKFNEM